MEVRSKAMWLLSTCALLLVLIPMIATAQGRPCASRESCVTRRTRLRCPASLLKWLAAHEVVYTDVDGRYVLEVPPGKHQLKVLLDGYQERLINVEAAEGRP